MFEICPLRINHCECTRHREAGSRQQPTKVKLSKFVHLFTQVLLADDQRLTPASVISATNGVYTAGVDCYRGAQIRGIYKPSTGAFKMSEGHLIWRK